MPDVSTCRPGSTSHPTRHPVQRLTAPNRLARAGGVRRQVTRRTRRAAGRRRPGSGRRRRGRSGPPAASTCRGRCPGREDRLLPRVRVLPLAHQSARGVRRAAQQRVVLARSTPPTPTRSISPLIAIIASTEPVQLGEVLGLGRLDHQRPGNRERHRRRMEAVVDEPLRDVVDAHAGVLGDLAQVEDALVRHQAGVAACRAPGSARSAARRRSCAERTAQRGRTGQPAPPISRT